MVVCGMQLGVAAADEQPTDSLPSAPLQQSVVLPNSTLAQSTFDAQAFAAAGRQQAAALQLGPIWAYPALGVAFGRDSNITRAAGDTAASTLLAVSPIITADMLVRGDRYTMGYLGNFTRYGSSAVNNFNINEVQLQAQNTYTSSLSSQVMANLLYSIDPPGMTQRVESIRPDRYRQGGVKGLLSYGGPDTRGRVEFAAGYQKKRYLNNDDVTRFADLASGDVAGRFFYRIAPKTQTFIEFAQADYNYVLNAANQDSKERRIYAGAAWDATAKTSGNFKLGLLNKDFASAAIKNFHGLGWDGRIRWLPLTYSTVDLQTARSTSDSTGVGDYLVNRLLGIGWKHDWSSFVSTSLGYTVLKSDFIRTNRRDTVNTALGRIDYRIRRWLTVGVDYIRERRNSSDPTAPYSKNQVMVWVNATL